MRSGVAAGAEAAGPLGHAPRVAVSNLGCRVNRVELDAIAGELVAAGCELVDEESADLVVVNTCAVTGEAEAKARKAVRHAAALAQRPQVLATGCVASLFADELAALADNVEVEPDKDRVATRALSHFLPGDLSQNLPYDLSHFAAGAGVGARTNAGERGAVNQSDASGNPSSASAAGGVAPSPLAALDIGESVAPGHAITPTGRMRPGLKVQDGCDHRCTYCIVWKARGRARSLDAADVVSQVRALVSEGAREVVLTGIDLGRYESQGLDLAGLLDRVLDQTEVGRVRLSSVEPAGVTDELLRVMAASDGRVAEFLHVPLQAGCDETLRRMGRPYTVAEYRAIVDRAREAVPHLALACDLIVGFPGETDEDFATSLETCREIGFAKMHVFRYSKRPGTPAATMEGQAAPEAMAERSRAMREMAAASRRAYAESLVGTSQLVLVERAESGVTGGLVEAHVGPGYTGELVRMVPHHYIYNILL